MAELDLEAVKQRVVEEVDRRADVLVEASHQIHDRPELDMRVVGFIEIDAGKSAPGDYVNAAAPEYDYVVFTEPTPRADPCKTLRFKPR